MRADEHEAMQLGFLTYAGTAEEVRHQLRQVKGGQVVAVVLDRSSEHEANVIEQVLAKITYSIRSKCTVHTSPSKK